MKTIEIKQDVFEPGDLLNAEMIKTEELKTTSGQSIKRNVIRNSNLIIIMKTFVSKYGFVSYKVMNQSGLCTKVKSTELESAKFIKNMKDFAEFFGPVEEEQ